jgi:hypothetical protein
VRGVREYDTCIVSSVLSCLLKWFVKRIVCLLQKSNSFIQKKKKDTKCREGGVCWVEELDLHVSSKKHMFNVKLRELITMICRSITSDKI